MASPSGNSAAATAAPAVAQTPSPNAPAASADVPTEEAPPEHFNIFSLLSTLRNTDRTTTVPSLDHLFSCLSLQEREWQLILSGSTLENNEFNERIKSINDLIIEHQSLLTTLKRSFLSQETLNKAKKDEAEVVKKILAKCVQLHPAVFLTLKPLFSEMDTFMEARGSLPHINLNKHYAAYAQQKGITEAPEEDEEDESEQAKPLEDEEEEDQEMLMAKEESDSTGKNTPSPELGSLLEESVLSASPSPQPGSIQPKFMEQLLRQRHRTLCGMASILDFYLICIFLQVTAIAFAEYNKDRDTYLSTLQSLHKGCSHLIRFGLPLFERLFVFERRFIKHNVFHKSFAGIGKGSYNKVARTIVRKVRLLDDIARSFDIFIFPPSLKCHEGGVKCIAVSHLSNKWILTAGYDSLLRIWDLPTGRCLAQFVGHNSIVTWCAFSSQDTFVVSGSFDGTVKIWDAQTAECLITLRGHTDSVIHCDLSSNDSLLLSASMDCTVRLWKVSDGQCLRIFTGHKHWVKAVRFTPNGDGCVTAGLDQNIFVWDLHRRATLPLRTIQAHTDNILDFVVQAPHVMITTARDQTVKRWNIATGDLVWSMTHPGQTWSNSLSFSPDGKLFAAGCFDNCVTLHQSSDGKMLRQFRAHNEGILCVRFVTKNMVLVGTSTGHVQIIQFNE